MQKAVSGFEPLSYWLSFEEWVEWIVFLFVLFFLGQDRPSDVWWGGNTAEREEVFYFSWPKATSDCSAR